MHHVLFDRVGALGQRHLAGDLGLLLLEVPSDPSLDSPCWPDLRRCPPAKLHRNSPLRHRKAVGFHAKIGIMAATKGPTTPKDAQGTQCPISKSATCRWSTTRRPARSPASRAPASTSSSPNSSASSGRPAAASPRCSTSSRASSRRPAARSGSAARRSTATARTAAWCSRISRSCFRGAPRSATSRSAWR